MSLRWKLFRFLKDKKLLDSSSQQEDLGASIFQSSVSQAKTNHGSAFDQRTSLKAFSAVAVQATCSAHQDTLYVFGREDGFVEVFILNTQGQDGLKPTKSIRYLAHDKAIRDIKIYCKEGEENSRLLIVTVGEDSKGCNVKVWSPKYESKSMSYTMKSVIRLVSSFKPTRLALSNPDFDLDKVAVGGEDGVVILFVGDIKNERFSKFILENGMTGSEKKSKVMFLEFLNTTLFCVTESSVETILSRKRPKRELVFERVSLDSQGCALGRASTCLLTFSNEVVIARKEALYFYNVEGRGPCLAFPSGGKNTIVKGWGNYLVHVTSHGDTNSVVVYDLLNKIVVYRNKLSLSRVLVGYDRLHERSRKALLVQDNGDLVSLEELPLRSRVNMLLERRMYQQAVTSARTEDHNANATGPCPLLTHALKTYASDLVDHGDFDAAAEQLVNTLHGDLEPSSVILQLVEQPGVRSGLRRYLEALHMKDAASLCHTRVLITCYRRDHGRSSIMDVKQNKNRKPTQEPEWKGLERILCEAVHTECEVDKIIEACREAGLYQLAANVARWRSRNAALAKILIKDLQDVDEAFNLLQSISKEEALKVVAGSGHDMLGHAPRQFVDSVKRLLTSTVRDEKELGSIDWMMELFCGKPTLMMEVLAEVVEVLPSGGSQTVITTNKDLWMALFQSALLSDLEAKRDSVNSERLLADIKESDSRGMDILKNPKANIEKHEALRLAEIYCHSDCIEYLYTSMHLYRELGFYLRLRRDSKRLLRACRGYGDRDPQLWAEGLRHFASALSNAKGSGQVSALSSFSECVRELNSLGAMLPTEVLDLVAEANPKAPWSVMKNYLTNHITSLKDEKVTVDDRAQELSKDILSMKKEMERLGKESVAMVRATCALCDAQLDIPCVHFFCKHSYHIGCISKSDRVEDKAEGKEECPMCSDEEEQIQSRRANIARNNKNHEAFFQALATSKDGLSVIMDYLENSPFRTDANTEKV
eukprot:Plantae.Rhodophyta-Hildenbrandia_rubra.ctg673.p1 GENE.Plantae.Rhodophyta-Hildenbrandia_rubra.ctg673~~Plantae.Rhodophyta-Hildenbrandia_rubra.ctg673.p1  ORF type:complete len:990 (+),score=158.70 Plantae.Rhodophyta-Hildenbrandia_rubra.ctg673:93-3062(+)